MGQAQRSSNVDSLYLFQASQDIDQVFNYLLTIAQARSKSFNISLGAHKTEGGIIKYNGIVACIDHNGQPQAFIIDVATSPADLVRQAEQFLKRLDHAGA